MWFKTAAALFLIVLGQGIAVSASPVESLEQQVLEVLRSGFPEAVLEQDPIQPEHRVFASNTRTFIIYTPNTMGDWQAPNEVTAPDRGGILVRFYIKDSPWSGAAFIPYNNSTDYYVFSRTTIIRSIHSGSGHLWAQILTPRMEPPVDLERKLIRVFNGFDEQH